MNKIPFTVGLLVRVKYYYDDEYPRFWDETKEMGNFMNQIVTIRGQTEVYDYKGKCFHIEEDTNEDNDEYGFYWRDIDFQKVNTPIED